MMIRFENSTDRLPITTLNIVQYEIIVGDSSKSIDVIVLNDFWAFC